MAVACPQCGTQSLFNPRREEVDGITTVFAKCIACPYKVVIREGPTQIIKLEEEVQTLEGRLAAGETTVGDLLSRRKARLASLITTD